MARGEREIQTSLANDTIILFSARSSDGATSPERRGVRREHLRDASALDILGPRNLLILAATACLCLVSHML